MIRRPTYVRAEEYTDQVYFLRKQPEPKLDGGREQLGVVSVAAWTIVTTGALFLIIKKTIGLRVSKIEEIEGLDVHEHGAEAYADFVIKG